VKILKLGICFLDEKDKIVSKRVIGTNWSIDIDQKFEDKFNISMMEEIALVMIENINLELTSDVIKEMLNEIKERGRK
jgi:hypothetical protein